MSLLLWSHVPSKGGRGVLPYEQNDRQTPLKRLSSRNWTCFEAGSHDSKKLPTSSRHSVTLVMSLVFVDIAIRDVVVSFPCV